MTKTAVTLVSGKFSCPWIMKSALDIRYTVFVNEQGVPADLERDEIDDRSLHIVAYIPASSIGNPITSLEQDGNILNADMGMDETVLDNIENGNLIPIATARTFTYDYHDAKNSENTFCYKIGRVAVLKEYRKKYGLGKIVMNAIESLVINGNNVKENSKKLCFLLHAQSDKYQFYEKCGYHIVLNPETGIANEFEEDGIMHYKMAKYP